MRPLSALVSKEEALARLLAAAAPVARVERVALEDARGRVVAADVRAPFAVPPFARATMDGYALRAEDAREPGARLRLVGEVLAGASAAPQVRAGEATRIATGAPIPPGADAVARVEDTSEEEGAVVLRVGMRARRFVDAAGSDLAERALVVARGQVLSPARLGLLASIGMASVDVLAKPRVGLLSSGDELLRPGEAPAPGRIYDSNGATLSALLAAHGADVSRLPAQRDDLAALTQALASAARDHDMVVITGGASAGAKDLVVDAARALGDVLFHGVRVKPGKPLLAARIGACLLVGLPGNPTSALSNGAIFVAPTLRRIAGLPPDAAAPLPARLATPIAGEPDRYLFLPVRVEDGVAHPTFKGSGALTSLAASDGWIGVPEGARVDAGAVVDVHAW